MVIGVGTQVFSSPGLVDMDIRLASNSVENKVLMVAKFNVPDGISLGARRPVLPRPAQPQDVPIAILAGARDLSIWH